MPKIINENLFEWPESQNVRRTEYFPSIEILEIDFKPAGSYTYYKVPQDIWDQFKKSKSAGTFVAKMIKNKFRFTQSK